MNIEKELKRIKKEINEVYAEAGPKGWLVNVGNKTMSVNDLPPGTRKSFDVIRGYLKRDNLLPRISKESKQPYDIIFKANGAVEIYDDEKGNLIKTYILGKDKSGRI